MTVTSAIPTIGSKLGAAFARVEAVNVGHRKMAISSLGLEVDKRRSFMLGTNPFPQLRDTQLPHARDDGERAIAHYPYAALGQTLMDKGDMGETKVIPYCENSTGTVYRGVPWMVDPSKVLNM